HALSVSPAVVLSKEWLDPRTLKLTPVTAWTRATAYLLSISTTAQAQTGTALPEVYTLPV
ncbi:MAG: hypothetical protein ABI700_08920, partial [Chloroflexota bacterium]